MTPEQKAAYINAQAALLNAEITGMKAENDMTAELYRDRPVATQMPIPFTLADFREVTVKYEAILGHNTVIDFFESD